MKKQLSTNTQSSPDSIQQYRRRIMKNTAALVMAALLVLLSFAADLSIGPGDYPLSMVWETLWDKHAHGIALEVVVRDYRLPIATIAVLVGAMLATSGAQMQTLLNNPLAEPFTLGVASAASFGAALAILYGGKVNGNMVQHLFVTASAFGFSLLTCFLLLVLTRIKGLGQQSIVLFGIAIYFVFNALLALMQYNANETQLQQIVFWMMGSLTRADNSKILLCAIVLFTVMAVTLKYSWQLTTLRLGEATALSMGINIKRLQVVMLVMISLLAGLSVAFIGAVGFVGLVGPHIARLLIGEDQRFFIPLAALIGALMLSLTSIVSKAITPGILYPIGMITALIGVPVFISIILSSKRTNNL